jgi:hypothetical protein
MVHLEKTFCLFEISSHIFQSASHGPAKTSRSIIQKKMPSGHISFCQIPHLTGVGYAAQDLLYGKTQKILGHKLCMNAV